MSKESQSFNSQDSSNDNSISDNRRNTPHPVYAPNIFHIPVQGQPPFIIFPRVPDDIMSQTPESLPLTESYSPVNSLGSSSGLDNNSPALLHRTNAFNDDDVRDLLESLSQNSSNGAQKQSAISPNNFKGDKSPKR
jgi:hypothetical protein